MICINVMTKNLRGILRVRRWRERNPGLAATARAWRTGHPEIVRKYSSDWKKKNPELLAKIQRQCQLKRIGWTIERVEAFRVLQNNTCEICGMDFDEVICHADHEHTIPPKPRGLLCELCNRGLGHFKEDIEHLEKAISYLKKWGK